MNYSLFTSESVCAGHPDKICDQISDAVLDQALTISNKSRVAVETLVTANHVVLAGEVTCPEEINYKKIAKQVVKDLGYKDKIYNFGPESKVDVYIHQQSPDIALGVDSEGAGDQGMMFGYAVNETEELMPLPIVLVHELAKKMDELQTGKLPYLRPDGKTQVTVQYEKGKPKRVEKIVLAKPLDPKIDYRQAKNDLYINAVTPILDKYKLNLISEDKLIFNGTGKWDVGGPISDTGVTGRKIVVDTYGGMARIGGGCFSGKDPTKVDRSAAYAARYIAKNIVANGLAERCEIQLSYVIGQKNPIAKVVEIFSTGKTNQKVIEDFAWGLMGLSVSEIISKFNLRRPIYKETAAYGHFGNKKYPWEQIKR